MTERVHLRRLAHVRDGINSLFEKLQSVLSELVPFAEIEHIGSTSIPGSITKGDLDIAVRVEQALFEHAMARLNSVCEQNTNSYHDHQYQPYIYSINGHDVGIQLFISNSIYDKRFLTWRDELVQNSCLLERYNALKMSFDGKPMSQYRDAKSRFIRSHLNDDG